MTTVDEKYLLLTTFTRNGDRKPTAIWVAPVGDAMGFTTGTNAWKLKRLRNNPSCELQPCNSSGRIKEGTTAVTATGREATPDELPQVKQAINDKYGLAVKAINLFQKVGDLAKRRPPTESTGIILTLD